MKYIIIILIVLAVAAFIAFTWGKKAFDKITFGKPVLQGLDMQGISLADLPGIAFAGQTKTVTATIGLDIKNDNNFSIPFSSITAQLLYKGVVIAETTDNASHTIPKNGILPLSDNVNILLNNAGGNLLIEKIKGGHPQIDYVLGLKVFGIPIPSQKDSFTW